MTNTPNKGLSLQDKFDIAKKQSEGGNPDCGYSIDGRLYNRYLTNDEWDEFVRAMPPAIKKQFGNGSGGEMRERKTRYGNRVPPKMASCGSSSRMLYGLAKDIPDFNFEHKLPTRIGGDAHLDGFIKKSNLYIEAKCREIYGGKGEVKTDYDPLYDYLSRYTLLGFDRRNKMVTFHWNKQEIKHFDLKQMICHLLGIANDLLCRGIEPVNFLYLVYQPTQDLLSYMEDNDSHKIQEIWGQEKQEAESIDFKQLYYYIALYLHTKMNVGRDNTTKQIEKMAGVFSFSFCTQNDFTDHINRTQNVRKV